MTMQIRPPTSFELPALPRTNESNAAKGSFADAVLDAVSGAAQAQNDADSEVQKLARGEGNLHEAALTLEKADISMRLMTKMRNKIIEAYQEVMRTPV